MKKWLEIIQIIVLIIITIIFLGYIFSKKKSEAHIKVIENFQVNAPDYTSKYFDVSANYYTYTDSENGPKQNSIPPDQVILNIGSAFGNIDINHIPWDSENKELLPSEALWGVVSPEASMFLFGKMYMANQIKDLGNLQFVNGSFIYNDAVLTYGTTDHVTADALQYSEMAAMLALPFIYMHVAPAEKLTALGNKYLLMGGAGKSMAVEGTARDIATFNKSLQEAAAQINSRSIQLTTQFRNLEKSSLQKIAAGLEHTFAEGAALEKSLAKMIERSAANILKGTFIKLCGKLLVMATAVFNILGLLATIIDPVFGAAVETLYFGVIMPAIMYLQLPGSPIIAILDKWADSTGPCANGYVPLDQSLDSTSEIILSMIPILGDFLSFMYPYVCVKNGFYYARKLTYNPPKYQYYGWLTIQYLNWPPYDGTNGPVPVNGKYIGTGGYDENQCGSGPKNSKDAWGCGPYTDLDTIIANPKMANWTKKRMLGCL